MNGIALGPLIFSADQAPWLIGASVLFLLATLLGRSSAGRLGGWAVGVVLWSVIGARAGFVVAHIDTYLADPISVLAIWQGGFAPSAGAAAALAVSIWHLSRSRDLMVPAAICAGLAGTATFVTLQLLQQPAMRLPADITLTALDGSPRPTADWQGGARVINLWATWCPPCRREMPMMAGVANADPAVPLHFVNQGESPETIRQYLSQQGLLIAPLSDPHHQLMEHFQVPGLPATLFVAADGTLVSAHIGEISRAALLAGMERIKEPDQ